MLVTDFINAAMPRTKHFEVAFKRADAVKQIVYGEVYAPNVLDSYNEMMLPADVELLAHRFMSTLKNAHIDLHHDNKIVKASAVESFVASDDDPRYNPGAWVLAVKVQDRKIWRLVERGELNGYSFEALVYKVDADVEFECFKQVYGWTEENDGHSHAFFIQMDEEGGIVRGVTSRAEDGHYHEIEYGTATNAYKTHSHRIFLP